MFKYYLMYVQCLNFDHQYQLVLFITVSDQIVELLSCSSVYDYSPLFLFCSADRVSVDCDRPAPRLETAGVFDQGSRTYCQTVLRPLSLSIIILH